MPPVTSSYPGVIHDQDEKGSMSGVVAYQFTDAQNAVAVAFKLTDTSYRPINTEPPALLASFGGASPDPSNDALPPTLAPGDSLYASAVFDVTQLDGLFCLGAAERWRR